MLTLRAAAPRAHLLLAEPSGSLPRCLATAKPSYPPPLSRFIAKLDPASDSFPSEIYAAEIAKVLAAWSEALCESPGNVAAISQSLSETVTGFQIEGIHATPLRSSGPLRVERRAFAEAAVTGRDTVLQQWKAYLLPLAKIETAELEIYGLHILAESPLRVETELRCDLVGTGHDGTREQRVGSWLMTWVREPQSQRWIVHRWMMRPETLSRLAGPGFTDVTAHSLDTGSSAVRQLLPGIDHWRTVLDGACGIDVYGNHGIAVGDIDGAGCDSFYVCQPSGLPNRLFRNRGDGSFEDITEGSGTGILDGTASALFADFNNRGRQDLLVVRSTGPLLFFNLGNGRFEPRPDAFRFKRPPQGTFTSVAAVDYDRDGFLDVYFCVYSYYQGLNQYQFPSPYYDAQNGPPNFLFHNRGDGTFEDRTVASGMDQNNNRFSFAAAWCDYEGRGWPSLYVANDFGRKNFYHNNGDGTFTDVAHQSGLDDYGPGMSVCWLDADNNGQPDLYVANMWLMEGKRITASDQFLPQASSEIRAIYRKHNAGNSFYRNSGGAFTDKSSEAGTAMGRWSWSCASWDFDHDGFPDLYVANGFVSGPDRFDLQSFFWRQVAQRSLAAQGISNDYEGAWNAVNELLRSDRSWSGYERNVFYANNGDGTFSDVSGVLGLDLRDDSRAFALSDFDGDGRLEFVIKNRTGPQVRILRNDLEQLGNSLSVRLTGKVSNRDAIGAVVTIEAGALRQTKFVQAGSGFASQHTKDVSFGLGGAAGPVSLAVQWPAGSVKHYHNVPVNHRIHITESAEDFAAMPYRTRARTSGSPEPLQAPSTGAHINTWLVAPLFGPDIKLRDQHGDLHSLSAFRGQPALLSFFRTDCADGQEQIDQMKERSRALSAHGLPLIAVAVGANSGALPFPAFSADDRAMGAWNILWRYLFDRRRDLVLPVSFLLNREGAIVRIYPGAPDPLEMVSDSQSIPATPDAQFRRALPFPGPYYGGDRMAHNYFTDGIALVEYGYEDEASEAFERVVKADPNHAGAWFNLGTIYLGKKLFSDARRCLLESVRLNPLDADAWNNLGMIAGEQQNYEQALDYFEKASQANPNHLLAVQNMIKILQYQGRAADAQKTLEPLIVRAPENADLHLALGMALVAQKQMDRARQELETAVRLNPDNPDALNDLGALLLRTGHAGEALTQFDRCRALAPDFDRPYLNTAIAYKGQGQIPQARAVLSEFLSRHPENTDVRSALEKLSGN